VKNYTDLVTSAAPTAAARVRLRPVDARGVAIRDGLLADRQRVNREVTLLRGAEELERAGTLDNLRIAAGRGSGERRGMVFSDSDVYKWLKALAWERGRPGTRRISEQLVPGERSLLALDRPGDGPRTLLRRASDPGGSRNRAGDGRLLPPRHAAWSPGAPPPRKPARQVSAMATGCCGHRRDFIRCRRSRNSALPRILGSCANL
jgi:hypothetical protein